MVPKHGMGHGAALQALLDPDAARPILIAEAAAPHVQIPGETLPEAALARRLREGDAVVVVAHTLGPALARALRERPPALLILTGPADADGIPALPGTHLLGPEARLRVATSDAPSAGGLIVCATAPAELVALLVAQKAVEQYAGTAFEAPLTNAFAKLTAQLDGPVTVALGAARHVFSFKAAGPAKADLELFRQLSQAVLETREVAFDYRSLGAAAPARRRVQPWHLCCVDNQWYLIGNDIDRAAKRTFALPRIAAVELTRRTFARPADFSIRDHLGGSFGIIAGTGDYRVRLRFDAWAGQLVRERFWHDTQELTNRRDGGAELVFQLDSLAERFGGAPR